MSIPRLVNISICCIALAACSSADHASQSPQQSATNPVALASNTGTKAAVQAQNPIDLPDMVLVGTDVMPLSGYRILDLKAESLSGDYFAETGGAEMSLTISSSNGHLLITRTFSEPGIEPHVKTYDAVTYDDQAFYKPNELNGKVVADGVLLHEATSGIDGIPETLWILYSKK